MGRLHTSAHALLFCISLLVAGCATRPSLSILEPVSQAPPGSHTVQVMVASLQSEAKPGSSDDVIALSGVREVYGAYDVAIPAGHAPGRVELPIGGQRSTSGTFTVTSAQAYSQGTFFHSFDAISATKPPPQDVVVFVHGFNTSYQEAVLRAAQLQRDSETREPTLLVSWPSFAKVTRYGADRERAIYSRDFLERVLTNLAQQPHVGRIHVIAHSMGSMVAMEALRQASLKRNTTLLGKLGAVVLISPDVDLGIFNTQLDALGPTARHLRVIVTKDDIALAVSRKLVSGLPRVGSLDPQRESAQRQALLSRGVSIIDLTDTGRCDALRHSSYTCVTKLLRPVIVKIPPGSEARL